MKKISIILSFVIAGLFSAAALHAVEFSEKAYIESYHGRTDIPVPTEVVTPTVVGYYDAARVELKFVVDETGTPRNITVNSFADKDVAAALTDAVKEWKFAPAHNASGTPVAKTVILPFLLNSAN